MGRKSDAKERLIEAVLDLIWEGSYGSLRIDDICAKAEVKKGSFYYFFPSKDALAVTALEHYWENSAKPFMDKHFSPSMTPMDRIQSYIKGVIQHQRDIAEQRGRVLGCSVLSIACETGTSDEAVANTARSIFSRKSKYLESCIRDAIAEGEIPPIDPEERAAGLWALMEGSMAQVRILGDLKPLERLPSLAVSFLRSPVEGKNPTSAH
ncbi:TetR/AcrR family transcriptional regulator [Pelagicoccus sp. SDUM812003]|uniref:TetR/AcrR family transcriptional regulator n=1 Tax=Pelagicoccus sp. SDUM812003 TaxID=3041267 RepID=UPI00280F0032|nr:TetR/AcrR family transcriptional regulator [Pelagicoccus sp. SDUM812003]MDQ8201400.1 TetR/AcrR family transcriptional regulator [Pelagicoccus sp. SDUM812003]